MEISKLHIHIEESEFCERVLTLLRNKVPPFVTIDSVTIDGNEMCISGVAEKVGTHRFKIKFQMRASSTGCTVILKLKDAYITNVIVDFAVANAALSQISDSPGISYSWWNEELSIDVAALLHGFGVAFTPKTFSMNFDRGVDVDFS